MNLIEIFPIDRIYIVSCNKNISLKFEYNLQIPRKQSFLYPNASKLVGTLVAWEIPAAMHFTHLHQNVNQLLYPATPTESKSKRLHLWRDLGRSTYVTEKGKKMVVSLQV